MDTPTLNNKNSGVCKYDDLRQDDMLSVQNLRKISNQEMEVI